MALTDLKKDSTKNLISPFYIRFTFYYPLKSVFFFFFCYLTQGRYTLGHMFFVCDIVPCLCVLVKLSFEKLNGKLIIKI